MLLHLVQDPEPVSGIVQTEVDRSIMQVVEFQTRQHALPEPAHPVATVMQSHNAGALSTT